ncbi:MAG: T9SS type A sorting domain-containing protein [Prevotella sp.]
MKLISIRTLILLTLLMCGANSFAQNFSGGSGAQNNPYLISTVEDLKELSTYVMSDTNDPLTTSERNTYNKYFKMTRNIDMNGVTDFIPIGGWANSTGNSFSRSFAGHFDGGNFEIRNLVIEKDSNTLVGLFGLVVAGSIKNLGVVGSSFKGREEVGGFIAFVSVSASDSLTISDCYTTGNVYSDYPNSYSGGFIAHVGASGVITISNCYATGSVSATATTTSTSKSYVTSTAYSGGFIARVQNSGVINISGSYATGNVSATATSVLSTSTAYSGGFIACGLTSISPGQITISDCYATGNVEAESSSNSSVHSSTSYVGGFIADISNTGVITISNCYATGTLSPSFASSRSSDSYSGGFMGRISIPDSTSLTISHCHAEGKIDSSSLGIYSYSGGFVGRISIPGSASLILSDCYATGDISCSSYSYSGGFAGMISISGSASVTISGCYAEGNVSGPDSYSYSGGFAGSISSLNSASVTISDCHATGDVHSASTFSVYCGGLVGIVTGSITITDSYATGNVSSVSQGYYSDFYIGGFIASVYAILTISDCYATGNVSATNSGSFSDMYTGGFIAYIQESSLVTISNSYATGNVSASNSGSSSDMYTGGFLAYIAISADSLTVSNSYFLQEGSINNELNAIGAVKERTEIFDAAITPKTKTELQSSDMVTLLNAGKTPGAWGADIDPDINGGYPILLWQTADPASIVKQPVVDLKNNLRIVQVSTGFYVEITGNPLKLAIFDNSGRLLQQMNVSSNQFIDLTRYAPGVYFIKTNKGSSRITWR